MSAEWAQVWLDLSIWLVGILALVITHQQRKLHVVDVRLAQIEAWQVNHIAKSCVEHKHLDELYDKMAMDVQRARDLSSKQMEALSAHVDKSIEERRQDTRELHKKIDRVSERKRGGGGGGEKP